MSETVKCPGCKECGEKCGYWRGEHLWTSYHTAIDINDIYYLCNFCWERRDSIE